MQLSTCIPGIISSTAALVKVATLEQETWSPFTDGDTTLTHIVKNLGVTEVNAEEDTISGTANSGVVVNVWPHETGQQIQVTAGNSGNWQVDFTDIFDIKPNDCGRSEIRDELGLSTAVDWCAPKPWLIAFPENDAVEGWEWPAGKTITLTIDNAPEGFDPRGNLRSDYLGGSAHLCAFRLR